ncbi:late competence protein ComER [Desmospora profundinema]|uniref:Pyrroline-5-carboxylate reductase n=1 Tax=Desmospora profundinema TaxID=1571184 RepID=A0ABU1IL23_9BACL|nr:late competence protein ComER [Desmospora profundinema]MDR6225108.1 competence protein ComER [Desmospora profundinema]
MAIGFIGTGSMGRTLIQSFIHADKLAPEEIVVHNRTRNKAEELARNYPGLRVAADNRELVRQSSLFFLCVKPGEFRHVLEEIQDCVRSDQIAISITSPVMIRDLEEWLPAKVAKIIPSITQAVHAGHSLFIPGERLHATDREILWNLFSAISRPLVIEEDHVRIASDLASCSPAFLAHLLEKLADAAVEETNISREQALALVTQMTDGLGRLLTEGGFTLKSLQERVAVPGGITRKGLDLLDTGVGSVFHDLIRLTHAKYAEDVQQVKTALLTEKERNH